MSIISTIQVGLCFSLALSIIAVSQSMVTRVAKVSKSIPTISTIQKVGVSISLGLGLRLSNGNSSQKSLEENKSNHNSVQTMRGESLGEISQLTMAT